MNTAPVTEFTNRLPLPSGHAMPDRFRIALTGMMTEGWLLYGAWAAGGGVLALLGHWQVALLFGVVGAASDMLFQRYLRRLRHNDTLTSEQGINKLMAVVATRFSLGVAAPLVILFTAHSAPAMAAVMMLQAWSICVAMVQFSAVRRLFLIAATPPLLTVAAALWPYLLGDKGPALFASLVLLVAILTVISRQLCQIWQAWSRSWEENVDLIRNLNEAREAAEAASAAKSTFLATMSHEVRTPLNGILGVAQMMALKPLRDDQRQDLDIIRRSGESLLATLNSVLDLARIEADRLDLIDERILPCDLVQGCVDAFSPLASLKNIQISATVAPSALGAFRGDPVRLRQILDNLVGNALKFTAAGFVNVEVTGGEGRLIFEVKDTGPGIDELDLERIFRPFEQLDGSHTRSHDGSGLGLCISRKLAELMNGDLTASSVPGHGSTFSLEIPAIPCSMPETALAPSEDKALPAFTVLVAEDNPTNQLVIKSLLQHLGADVEVVDDGKAAVDRSDERAFDVVLMDVHMPVMDGLVATREIRSREVAQGRAPRVIIGVTGNAMKHQVLDCIDAGMDAVVAKPIQLSALVDALNAALHAANEPLDGTLGDQRRAS